MTWENRLTTLEAVLKCLNDASLTLNLAKCEFVRAVVTFHGKLVGQGQVRPVEAKLLLSFPPPRTNVSYAVFLGWLGKKTKNCLSSFPSNRLFEFRT